MDEADWQKAELRLMQAAAREQHKAILALRAECESLRASLQAERRDAAHYRELVAADFHPTAINNAIDRERAAMNAPEPKHE